MKRKDDEKERFRSRRIKLEGPIPLDLKMTRLPSRFLLKAHQKKLLSVKREEDDEKSKLDQWTLDLQEATLTRLPAKSLFKFRCVSKIWSSIIRSPRFVGSYYAMRPRLMIALSNGAFAPSVHTGFFIFSSSFDQDKSDSLQAKLDMTIPSLCLSQGDTCASVHGLIGFTRSGPFLVCNPSTRKVTTLPCIGARTHLGYDPVDPQFKDLTLTNYPYNHQDRVVHEVLALGGGGSESCNKITTQPYYTVTKAICINGFIYYGARTPTRYKDPVIVCFDVRHERLSFIRAPSDALIWEGYNMLIEYKGKLASIVRHPLAPFLSFDLWILEDVTNHDWSKQTFTLPFSLGLGKSMFTPGTNKAGEIIFAPQTLSRDVQPFYIFYYNVERRGITRVRAPIWTRRRMFRLHVTPTR